MKDEKETVIERYRYRSGNTTSGIEDTISAVDDVERRLTDKLIDSTY